MGLHSSRSIEPLLMKSGKMLAVEIKARIVAAHVSQMPMPSAMNVP